MKCGASYQGIIQPEVLSKPYLHTHCQVFFPLLHSTIFVWFSNPTRVSWLPTRPQLSLLLLACSTAVEQMELRGNESVLLQKHLWNDCEGDTCSPEVTKWHLSVSCGCKLSCLKWRKDPRIQSGGKMEEHERVQDVFTIRVPAVLFEDVLHMKICLISEMWRQIFRMKDFHCLVSFPTKSLCESLWASLKVVVTRDWCLPCLKGEKHT